MTSGNFTYFDNVTFKKLGKKIGPEHIMASGALPPGFPSIEIEGEHFWDGGIASNTPLDFVLDDVTDDLLIFQVDLFSARGLLPNTLMEAAEREKDIRFSSRTRMNTDKNKRIHNIRKALRDLIGKLPEDLKSDPSVAILNEAAKENTVTVVHLIYRSKNYEIVVQGLRLFPCRHGRALGRGSARRPSVDAPQGMAGAAAERRNHGDLRSHRRRHRNSG